MFVQFCREWHCWHRAVIFAPWVTCYMASEENTQGAHFVLQALSHFFCGRGCQPQERERVLLARVHLNTQYTGSDARPPDWCLHHMGRWRWKKTKTRIDWVTFCEKTLPGTVECFGFTKQSVVWAACWIPITVSQVKHHMPMHSV